MTRHMGKVGSNLGISIMLGIFRMEPCKAMVFGGIVRERSILGSGRAIRLMAMASISLRPVTIKVHIEISRFFHQVCQKW